MKQQTSNTAASVRARLLAGARQRGEDFNLTLQRYVAERFLYRLGASPHRQRFVLKGAMLFALWGGTLYRATRDVDFAAYMEDDPEKLISVVQEICGVACPQDGLAFVLESVRAEPIRDESEYHGFRVRLRAMLEAARIDLQIDVGLGDAIQPPPKDAIYPVLLDAPAPHILSYPHEAVVAEKFHTMVLHGERNTRFKDFYDVYVLAKEFSFQGRQLAGAIAATFEQRRTPITSVQSAALSTAFYSGDNRAQQWRAYLDRNRLPGAPADFAAVGERLISFLGPVSDALVDGRVFESIWNTGGPWRDKS